MHGTKLALLALAICLAISLFDGVDALSKKARARAAKAAKAGAAGVSLPPAKGSSKATPHTGKKTADISPNDLKQIIELLVDEVMLGKDHHHMAHVNFHEFKGKLPDHLQHPDIKPKHKIAAPHEIKEAQLKAIYAPLEVAIVTHTLAKMEKKELMEKIAKFMHAKTYYNFKGQKEPAHKVKELEQDPTKIIGQMIRAEAIEMMKKNGYYEHSDPKSRNQLKNVYPVMTKAMKIKEIAEKITHLVKEYNENHHGKDAEDKKKNDGNVKPHNHGEGTNAANKDANKKGLTVETHHKQGGSVSGSSIKGSPPPLPSASRSSGGVGGGLGLPSPSGHNSQTLDHTQTQIQQTHHEATNHLEEHKRLQAPKREEPIEPIGSNGTGDYNDPEASANNAGLGQTKRGDSESFAQTSETSSFGNNNDFDQSEAGTQVGDENETLQEQDTEFGDTPADVSRKENTGTGSASEDFKNTLTSTNEKEGTEDNLEERNEGPLGAGTGGVEGDMSENKVERSDVETDSVVDGNTVGGLASDIGDSVSERQFPKEDEEGNENGVNKVKEAKKADAETADALE